MFFTATDRRRAKRIETTVNLILNRIQHMPTNADLQTVIAELETTLTTEIDEITAALSQAGVSQENLDRLTALKTRISGIVNPPTEPPPAEPPQG